MQLLKRWRRLIYDLGATFLLLLRIGDLTLGYLHWNSNWPGFLPIIAVRRVAISPRLNLTPNSLRASLLWLSLLNLIRRLANNIALTYLMAIVIIIACVTLRLVFFLGNLINLLPLIYGIGLWPLGIESWDLNLYFITETVSKLFI